MRTFRGDSLSKGREWEIEIDSSFYEMAEKKAEGWSIKDKSSNTWSEGAFGRRGRSTFIGILGQKAFSDKFGAPFDIEYREGGSGEFDAVVYNSNGVKRTVEIKTTNTNFLMVRAEHNGYSFSIPDKRIYLAAKLLNEENRTAIVKLMGWTRGEVLKRLEMVPGRMRGATWKNYELTFCKLFPMEKFRDKYRSSPP